MLQDECVCQSCGKPIDRHEDFGTNSDWTRNQEFCIFCYHNGLFSEPDISKEEMVVRIAESMAHKTDLPKDHAYNFVDEFLSSLTRWQ